MAFSILLIDDHEATRETLIEVLKDQGHQVYAAANKSQAFEYLESRHFDLVFSDLKLPDGNGMEILHKSLKLYPQTPVIMITGHATIENAIEATRIGAYEYLTKPVDLNKLRVVSANALRLVSLERQISQSTALDAIVGRSNKILAVKELIKQIAHTDVTVLIQGESGTGKELVANAIQSLSARKNDAYVRVNIAALSKDLIESELFGHEKGSFSGAIRQRKGRFELADAGTLFLDEIGDMPIDIQVKLLRVLQEQELERVGGDITLPINIRLICATNLDLKKQVQENKFREDLYFRINVVRIQIPPLRERSEDILFLAEHFRLKYCNRYGKEKRFSDEVNKLLQSYTWPGNVRELENAIEGAVVMTVGDTITPTALPEEISGIILPDDKNLPPGLTIEEVDKRYILAELNRFDNNKTLAAKSLGIGLKTLYRKLESYGQKNNIEEIEGELEI